MIKITSNNKAFIIETEKSFQQLFSKGFGTKINTNTFSLDIYETAYLLEKNKIELFEKEKQISFNQLTKKKDFNTNHYLVYKDLKTKGHNPKSGLKYGFSFRVYQKEAKSNKDHALWLVDIITEKDSIKIKDLAGKNRIAHSTNKKLLLAIVDNENSITYFENNWTKL